jgi:diguanylate cyclase (GGDEF)-like protein/PAS domain S-box-containing protein
VPATHSDILHSGHTPRWRRWRPYLVGALVFVALAMLSFSITEALRQEVEQRLRNDVHDDTAAMVTRLEADLNANLFLANGLMAMVTGTHSLDDEEIQTSLKTLFGLGKYLRNIAFAPNNRVSQVYPLAGNEAAIGLYYPDIPAQWRSVKQAIERRTTLLAGPVPLRQGGVGLISRTPVYLEDGRYWGMLSLVIDMQRLFAGTGIAAESGGIRYAVRGKDARGDVGDCILGDCELFEGLSEIQSIDVPGGHWQIAAEPKNGWQRDQSKLDYLEAGAMIASLLLGLATIGYLRGRLRIETNERRLRTVLATASDGIIVIDQEGLIEEFNPAAEQLFGYGADEVLDTPLNRLMSKEDADLHNSHLNAAAKGAARPVAQGRDIYGLRKDGSQFPIEITVGQTVIDGRTVFVGILRDITERRALERRLTELATRDSLTGVENRHSIMSALEQASGHAKRYRRPLSVLMIDADHFKRVNDRYGHPTGDRVLVRLTQALSACLRQSDRLGRIGGEEFIAVLPETGSEQAMQVASRLLAEVAAARVHSDDGDELGFTVSIGIAASNDGALPPNKLLEQADQALYAAKAGGRNCQRLYTEAPNT